VCRREIGKAPPKINFIFSNSFPSVSHLNVARSVKFHNSATQFEIQFVGIDAKLDDMRIFDLVRQATISGHIAPPLNKFAAIDLSYEAVEGRDALILINPRARSQSD
jgi:hypothetical protein